MTSLSPRTSRLAGILAAGLIATVAVTGVFAAGAAQTVTPALKTTPVSAQREVTNTPQATAAKWTLPPTTGYVDYQLGGTYKAPEGVTVVARDSGSAPATNIYSICYLNGFQTQPGDRKWWLKHHKSLVLFRKGKPVIDKNWPDELILNTSTKSKRKSLAKIMAPKIKSCAKRGFKAVEFDNLDTFTRSKGKLSAGNNRELAKLYTKTAHTAGLAVAQKNTAEYAKSWKKKVGFDFAVAEECYRWNECKAYTSVYGTAVIDIEYADDLRGTFADACAAANSPDLMVLRDRDLVLPTNKEYIFEHC